MIMKKENALNNKGFSLVELIIVIAIMAILIGVLAPNMMRFVERSNVSNDVQTIDSLRNALLTALADPNVKGTDATEFSKRVKVATAITLDAALPSADSVTLEVTRTLNLPSTSFGPSINAALAQELRSFGTAATTKIYVQMNDQGNIIIHIPGTDKTGLKTPNATTPTLTNIIVPVLNSN